MDDEVSSLSAIVLDDAYYELILRGAKTVGGISVLDESHLIPFKAKAYLDLKARRQRGESIDSRKIKKHKRDALRLAQLLSGNEIVNLPDSVAADMEAFFDACERAPVNLKQIGIAGASLDDILTMMRSVCLRG